MKRIFTIFPWVLVLALGGILLVRDGRVSLGVILPFVSSTPAAVSNSPNLSNPSAVTKVTRIVDGDTIDLSTGQRARYIGIDTPETGDCFGSEATKKNKELVLSREVRLEKDVSETDRYKRLLRYVWARLDSTSSARQVDETMINEELVRSGYAKVSTYPPDVKYADKFVAAEREARENKRGLWADDACQVQGKSTSSPSNLVTQSPSCLIKGNISTKGEKIYHLPGCGSYDISFKETVNY